MSVATLRPDIVIPDTAADNPAVTAALARMTALYPKLIDLSLDRMRRLLADLGDPHRRLPPVIHVAGTNGKGSTVATMRAVLEASGHTVHVYTSPHLVRFAERIRLSGSLIGEDLLLELLNHVEAANAGRPITFFEVTTALAFLAFAQIRADAVLLETGMGGTYDATNVIERPLVTVLTAISMDHMQFLGDTIAKIAQEKANIMKHGAACVSVAQHPHATDVIIATAERLGVAVKWQNDAWSITPDGRGGLVFEGEPRDGRRSLWKMPTPNLPGRHQHQNVGAALAALEQASFVSGLAVPGFALRAGLRAIDWPARGQKLRRGPLVDAAPFPWEVWLDGGHNAGGGAVLADLAAESWADRPLHLVAGMLTTKPAEDFLKPLAARAASFTAVPIPDHAAAYAPEDLARAATGAGLKRVGVAPEPLAAVSAIRAAQAESPARIMICGSLYLAGDVLKTNG
ncbi:MAG: folylpolyglutamate synthase/dihydrofolate synthase family protein [Rhodospirillaceae bacterium]|nr:folylpolyglutamate synthase/dihydrofolate synthase family protein [Rhodospirillaceae bacterium]